MKASVIIPVYNSAEELKKYLPPMLREYRKDEYEFILINDGSADASDTVCKALEKKYKSVRYFSQENKGVSAARNLGIRNAKGKYLVFLDGDDELEKGAIRRLVRFFDVIYDDVDLLTYPIETEYNGRILEPHFRYEDLRENGIYDLTYFPFIGQTTMNIVVKNLYEENVLFDETKSIFEDQKYCCQVLQKKLRMGFYGDTKYIYHRHDDSSSGKLSGACFMFEASISFFEELFAEYETVPMAFQGLFVNDLDWRLHAGILLPYHYNQEQYAEAIARIRTLLAKCNPWVILRHPRIDFFEKFYWAKLRNPNLLECRLSEDEFNLYFENTLVVREQSPEMVVTRFRTAGGKLIMRGFLKSVFFQFWLEKPILTVSENGGEHVRALPLEQSTHNYYLSKEATQQFYSFYFECDTTGVQDISFRVQLGNYEYPVHFYFMPLVPFSNTEGLLTYVNDGTETTVEENRIFRFRQLEKAKEERIWLYYDCRNVAVDNGRLQFEHDRKIEDGIRRYYVITDSSQSGEPANQMIRFGSEEHQNLFCKAEKLVTAFIEPDNLIPFPAGEYDRRANDFHFEIVYLQHGVLHIEMPWKYSPERILADKIVISTEQEKRLWLRNGYREEELLSTSMPRFEMLSKQEKCSKGKKILFAPTWRSYLASHSGREWTISEKKLLASSYYRKISALLQSEELKCLLRKNGYHMDVKLHPIFSTAERFFPGTGEEIAFVGREAKESEYDLFITDFSSWLYDFLYLKVPILTFIPDDAEFRCGMNGYRSLNPEEADWQMAATEVDTLLEQLEKFFEAGHGMTFFADFYDAAGSMDNIYNELMKS